MAEPDWALWQSILQQLQADNVEVKRDLKDIAKRITALERGQDRIHNEITYALGMMVTVTRDMKDAQTRIDEVVERLEKLETR